MCLQRAQWEPVVSRPGRTRVPWHQCPSSQASLQTSQPEGRLLVLPLSISAIRQLCLHSVITKSRARGTDVHLRADVAFILIPDRF